MQLTIQDGILYVDTPHRLISLEAIRYGNVALFLATCGYRTITAQAIAYGTLSDRKLTILLAQRVKLLAIS